MNLSEEVRPLSGSQQQITHDIRVRLSRLRAGLDRFGKSWAARRQRARDLQVLHLFSDRELWDVGLSRSDFLAISKGTYRRE